MASAAFGAAFRHLRDLFGGGSVVGLGDGALLARYARSKDPAAFEALVIRHGPMVLATCRAVLKNEHDVEDAFQATFLVLAKKAETVKGSDALGGWLHRVAYRASVEASRQARRRRRVEAEAQAMATSAETARSRFDDDLKPILHEEIDRLPEPQRLAVVLCDLEGLTYDQAAERLQWTEPTLRTRLAKARKRLKDRLARRGVTTLVIGASLAPKGTSAAVVPPSLLKATVAAATGTAPASLGAMLLTHALLKGMLMTKIKVAATATLAAFALAAAGVLAIAASRGEDPPKPDGKASAKTETNPTAPSGKKPLETVEVKGRVVASDGKPVAGASVRGFPLNLENPVAPEATTDASGRFSIRISRDLFDLDHFDKSYPWLVASAPGHGIGWNGPATPADPPLEQLITLTEEGPPIEGRLIDLEGRPIAGATVRTTQIWYDANGDLPAWIAQARNGEEANLWQGLQQLSLERLLKLEAKTGPDGRFKLTGVGRDRIAEILVSGRGVASSQLFVFSRPEREIRSKDRAMPAPWPFVVHAPKFELALPPSKTVRGTILDKDSGLPLAGIALKAAVFSETNGIPAPGIEATTDAQGHYTLEGLPRSPSYKLFVEPKPGLPYLAATLTVPAETPALEPVTFDFRLKRAIVVRGKVTNKATGRPISQADINYFTFPDNPNLDDYPGFDDSNDSFNGSNDDGSFEVVVLPGRGLITAMDQMGRYRLATGYEKISGYIAGSDDFDTVPSILHAKSQNVIVEINPTLDSGPVHLELETEPGHSVTIEVVGPDGRPVESTKARGINHLFGTLLVPQDSASFEVVGLDPTTPRRVVVQHEPRKLIGSVYLKGDETGKLAVPLQPWGTITGRIVDDEGQPRPGMFLRSPTGDKTPRPETDDILPGSDWNSGVRGGNDGRFRVEGIVPGLKYQANAHGGDFNDGHLFGGVTVKPGEVKDLGDLKVQPPKKNEDQTRAKKPQEEPASKKPDAMVEVQGRVLTPDGKAVVGARVTATSMSRKDDSIPSSISGLDGKFSIRVPKSMARAESGDESYYPWLVASSPGFGVGWTTYGLRADRVNNQVITLVEEGPPIEGRLIDLEGRPIAGATVDLDRIWYEGKGDFAGWLAKTRLGAFGNLWQGLDNLPMWKLPPIQAKTGPDGRFKLTGVGIDRVADLIISGPGISTTEAFVLERPEPGIHGIDKSMTPNPPFIVHAPTFELAVAPSKLIEGFARDKDTGKGIAGIEIKAAPFDPRSLIPTPGIQVKTDAEGHYRIDGLPKAAAYRLFLSPGPGLPYTPGLLQVEASSPGLDTLTHDFTIKRAMIVRGKVTDKVTGRPISGYVDYYAFRDNPHLSDYPGFSSNYSGQATFRDDGSYEIVALPGPGLIAVRGEVGRHQGKVGAEKIRGYDPKDYFFNTAGRTCSIGDYHVFAEINPDPKNPDPTVDLQADPGLTVALDAVDEAGQPVVGTWIKGKADLFPTSPSISDSSRIEIHALDPTRPRRVIITHPARKLIGSICLKGNEVGPITVKMVPWGTVTGRVVDDEGLPRKGMFLRDFHGPKDKNAETDDILPGGDWNQGIGLGSDGKFRVEGLAPGLRYHAFGTMGRNDMGQDIGSGDVFNGVTVKPGEVKDLGDLKVQPTQKMEE